MTPPLNDTVRSLVVCVITVLDKGQIRDQFVFASLVEADKLFKKLCTEHGKIHVVRTSKRII